MEHSRLSFPVVQREETAREKGLGSSGAFLLVLLDGGSFTSQDLWNLFGLTAPLSYLVIQGFSVIKNLWI